MVKEKRKRKPFWKKYGPEWKHVTDHVGKVIDNSNLSQVIEALLYGGLAFQGASVMKDIRGAIIGPIGLKLAMSANIVSGASGVAILAGLGLASVAPSLPPPPYSKTAAEVEQLAWWEKIFYPSNGFVTP